MGEPGIDMEFAARNADVRFADRGAKQQASSESMEKERKTKDKEKLGEQGIGILESITRLNPTAFDEFRKQLIGILAELNAETGITPVQVKNTLMQIKSELADKLSKAKFVPEAKRQLISLVDEAINASEDEYELKIVSTMDSRRERVA